MAVYELDDLTEHQLVLRKCDAISWKQEKLLLIKTQHLCLSKAFFRRNMIGFLSHGRRHGTVGSAWIPAVERYVSKYALGVFQSESHIVVN